MSHTRQFRSKGTWAAIFFTAITAASLLAMAGAQTKHARAAANSRYHVVHGWPVLPEGRVLGAVAGIGVDSHDNVFVFHRNDRTWPASNELRAGCYLWRCRQSSRGLQQESNLVGAANGNPIDVHFEVGLGRISGHASSEENRIYREMLRFAQHDSRIGVLEVTKNEIGRAHV